MGSRRLKASGAAGLMLLGSISMRPPPVAGSVVTGVGAGGTTTRVSVVNIEGNNNSDAVDISADGRYVAFFSYATNLVPGDTNGRRDVFVRDRLLERTERVSVASDGTQANGSPPVGESPSITADGRYVAFSSAASNLVADDTNVQGDVFVHDRHSRVTTRVSVDSDGRQRLDASDRPSITGDGRYVVFASGPRVGSPPTTDVFVHDRQTGETTRASTSPVAAPSGALESDISEDGRFVTFASLSSGVVPGDANGTFDVFVHDRITATVERLSVSAGGVEGNGPSRFPDISHDGRYIAFGSGASNLVPGDTNGSHDVFAYDRETRALARVSLTSDGSQAVGGNSVSPKFTADGSALSFLSQASNLVTDDTNGETDVFFHERTTGTTSRVSVASDGAQSQGTASSHHAVSDDGTFVAFSSTAWNLVPGDENFDDVFVRDRATPATTRVSVANASEANQASSQPSVNGAGTMLAFESDASNLVSNDTNSVRDVFVAALGGPGSSPISRGGSGVSAEASVSDDDRYVAFTSIANNLVADDANGFRDVFVRDRGTFFSHTRRVTDPAGASEADGHSFSPAIAANGRFVAFASAATNLVEGDTNGVTDVFVHDRETATTVRLSVNNAGKQANGSSNQPAISADGRYVTFSSTASNLVKGDTNGVTDVFVRDLVAATTTRVSVSGSGAQAAKASDDPSISGDGAVVAFRSDAKNLVIGDTNGVGDVFVRNLVTRSTVRVSVASTGTQAKKASSAPAISANGAVVAFSSKAGNLVTGDTNGLSDVFVHELATSSTERVSVGSGGSQADGASSTPSLSGDGRIVAFASDGTNLVADDTNGVADIFVRTR